MFFFGIFGEKLSIVQLQSIFLLRYSVKFSNYLLLPSNFSQCVRDPPTQWFSTMVLLESFFRCVGKIIQKLKFKHVIWHLFIVWILTWKCRPFFILKICVATYKRLRTTALTYCNELDF